MDQANYLWLRAYRAAVWETDESLLPRRILEAISAIEIRLLAPIESEEDRAIKHARTALETLRIQRPTKSNGHVSG
jgi:hypothetical protein